jgi:2-methylaconitate cis-trans-isomerase PrpF
VDFLNTNTSRMLQATFPLDNRTSPPTPLISPEGNVPGVSGLGIPVLLSFLHPSGSKTAGLLPTGHVSDEILGHQVTCVDAGNPCIFVRASDFPSLKPTILPVELLAPENAHILERLESLRRAAAVQMGVCQSEADTPRVVPKIALVSPPQKQVSLSGEVSEEEEMDLVIRFISDGQPHRAIPLTGAVCTAAAAGVRGGIVESCLQERVRDFEEDGVYDIKIAQPSGVMSLRVSWKDGEVEKVGVVRSTRKIMQGEVYWVDADE